MCAGVHVDTILGHKVSFLENKTHLAIITVYMLLRRTQNETLCFQEYMLYSSQVQVEQRNWQRWSVRAVRIFYASRLE